MNNTNQTPPEKTDDFREKFRDLLRLQMETLIFRSKIPAYENGEVDTLFDDLEQVQADLAADYKIVSRKESAPGEDDPDPMIRMEKRMSLMEKKFDLLLEHLNRLDDRQNPMTNDQ